MMCLKDFLALAVPLATNAGALSAPALVDVEASVLRRCNGEKSLVSKMKYCSDWDQK